MNAAHERPTLNPGCSCRTSWCSGCNATPSSPAAAAAAAAPLGPRSSGEGVTLRGTEERLKWLDCQIEHTAYQRDVRTTFCSLSLFLGKHACALKELRVWLYTRTDGRCNSPRVRRGVRNPAATNRGAGRRNPRPATAAAEVGGGRLVSSGFATKRRSFAGKASLSVSANKCLWPRRLQRSPRQAHRVSNYLRKETRWPSSSAASARRAPPRRPLEKSLLSLCNFQFYKRPLSRGAASLRSLKWRAL